MIPNPSPPQEPVGRCIYCGTTKGRLTREHVIPRALAGNMTLPKASCDSCAKVTTRLEGYVGRKVFRDLRVQHGFRMQEPPTHLPIYKQLSGGKEPPDSAINLVPVGDHPGYILTFAPEPAGILTNRPRDAEFGGHIIFRGVTPDGEERIKRLKEQGLSANLYRSLSIGHLGRFHAKVALGFAVAACGIDGFWNRLGGVVLGLDKDWSHWVGGTTPDMIEFVPSTHGKLTLHRTVVYSKMLSDGPWLLVQVQLCAYFGLPTYTVVIGELSQTGADKLGSGE